MTRKKLESILKAKIRRAKKQRDDLRSINTNSIKNINTMMAVQLAKENALLLAYGRLYAYREIYRELKQKA